jgi:hypothetical protein
MESFKMGDGIAAVRSLPIANGSFLGFAGLQLDGAGIRSRRPTSILAEAGLDLLLDPASIGTHFHVAAEQPIVTVGGLQVGAQVDDRPGAVVLHKLFDAEQEILESIS